MEYNYPTNIQIHYTNDDEYRECIIRVFHYDETSDGDDTFSTKILDIIFEKTHVNFKELYQLSSAVMMMEELDIGLAVLFSYDHFSLFHLCLCDYLSINQEEQPQFIHQNQHYLQLINTFKKIEVKEPSKNEELDI